MKRAQQLLEHTNETIKVIAYSVGFSDPLHFSKATKQFFHKTPSQTRKNTLIPSQLERKINEITPTSLPNIKLEKTIMLAEKNRRRTEFKSYIYMESDPTSSTRRPRN